MGSREETKMDRFLLKHSRFENMIYFTRLEIFTGWKFMALNLYSIKIHGIKVHGMTVA
jgi:hypothetical protein